MRKYLALSILVSFTVIISGCSFNAMNNSQSFSLDKNQKKIVAKYVYDLVDSYFTKKEVKVPSEIAKVSRDYYRIYLTFYIDGKTRCSQSGSAKLKSQDRISDDLKEAVKNCIEEKRFDGPIKNSEYKNIDIAIDVLYNQQNLNFYSLDDLKKEFELGIDALRIEQDGKGANFKSSVPITKNYTHKALFENLCKKANLDLNCYTKDDVSKYKYNDLAYYAPKNGEIVDLYRYNILVDENSINQDRIYKSIAGGYEWYKKQVDENGIVRYLYLPSINQYPKDDNDVRRMATNWAVTELMDFLKNDEMRSSVDKTLDRYLANKKTNQSGAYIEINGNANIAYNAFAIMALINSPDYPDSDKLAEELASAIVGTQQENGSYKIDFIKDDSGGVDYYPGEAMLALMKFYEKNKDKKYLESVEKAFNYYRNYWRENKNTAFIPWHSQAYLILYNATENKELADFVFEMNDWIIDNDQQFKNKYSDYIGGFKERPSNSTASYLEGINDAYALAKEVGDMNHASKYSKSIRAGARFVMQTQYIADNTFYLENSQKAIGGFRQSPINNSQRDDYTQHATLSLIKTYANNVYNP